VDVSSTLGISEAGAGRTLDRVYERLPVMMYAVNGRGIIVDVNQFWLKRLGYRREQVVGRSSADFMPAGDSEDRQRVWAKLVRGEDITSWAVQYVSATGELMDGVLYGAAVMDGKGGLQGAIASVFDVTELRAAQRERDQLETELRLSQKLEAIGQLAAGIAHEINTPSQYVSDNLSFMQEAVTGLMPLLASFEPLLDIAAKSVEARAVPAAMVDDYRTLIVDTDLEYVRREIPLAIQQSRDGVAQIKKIVLAMKEFSHPGTDEKEAVNINRAIEATVLVARNEWKYVADVEMLLDKALPAVEAIPSSINQTVLNLVVNAAHAIEDANRSNGKKGLITITTRHDGDFVEIGVEDSGCGIAPENLGRIFDPFFTTKKVGKGTGQGLAIVRRVVVDRHGGAIDVQSELGMGTRFVVRLPITAPIELEQFTA
jgi:two-component system, NtrC family, sensor kinase